VVSRKKSPKLFSNTKILLLQETELNNVGRFLPFLQATKALRESRGIALSTLFLDLGTRRG
jgi:hypothetical protein